MSSEIQQQINFPIPGATSFSDDGARINIPVPVQCWTCGKSFLPTDLEKNFCCEDCRLIGLQLLEKAKEKQIEEGKRLSGNPAPCQKSDKWVLKSGGIT